ncbi:MAG: histidinol-phosphate transaminase [Propionibacteriaceae bacterium]|nr:histidinol-phosphate transaminase [Propionibacteriaceae bacterium]
MAEWGSLPIREELRDAHPYGAPQLDVPVRLNVNENPYPPSEAVRSSITQAVSQVTIDINRYPDREATVLRTKLAQYLGHSLTADRVWAANGSNEIWTQILSAFGGPGHSMLTFTPSYSMYQEYARNTFTTFVSAEKTPDYHVTAEIALEAITVHQPQVVAIASPDNPTGISLERDVLTRILEVAPGIVVVDEAYQEFSSRPSVVGLLADYPNLLVVRTMSKAFAFAGGRLGYAAASPQVIDALRIVRLPYHLSAITQAVAGVALDYRDEMLSQVDHIIFVRDQATKKLRTMGLTVVDSDTNFFLFGPFDHPHDTWGSLVDRGVLVRDTGVGNYLRTCIGTDEEMEIFFSALEDVLAEERTSS